jgi:magnesium chelatase subunit I
LKRRAGRKGDSPEVVDNPYRSITSWFDKGNHISLVFSTSDREKINQLYKIDGLHSLIKKHFSHASEKEAALLMEFVLHGLASYSLISKKILETSVEFKDLMGSMLNIQSSGSFDDIDEEDFN